MKILLVTSMFPPYCGGGVSSHVSDLATSLAKSGDETFVLTSRRGMPAREDEQSFAPPGVKITYCKSYLQMFSEIRRLIRDGKFDLIHYHSFNALALALFSRGINSACAFTIHAVSSDSFASIYGWSRSNPAYLGLRTYERIAFKWPDVTIAVSQGLYQHALSHGARKVVYVPNSVNCDFWKPLQKIESAHKDNIILIPRMLVPKNGIEYAIKAMATILREIPDAKMVIAGDGPLRNDLENLSSSIENNLDSVTGHFDTSQQKGEAGSKSNNNERKDFRSGSFSFLGEVPREKLLQQYWGADVVLIPSITSAGVQEATSISALEAMACEKPIIASEMGGLEEIISSGKEGILVPERDSSAIAKAVIQVLKDKQLARQLGEGARKRVLREFSIPVWTERIKEAYRRALDTNGQDNEVGTIYDRT